MQPAVFAGVDSVPPAVRNATLVLAAQLRAVAGGAGGGLSVLDAACGLLLAGRHDAFDDEQVRQSSILATRVVRQNTRCTLA